jgi:hypothetical protein
MVNSLQRLFAEIIDTLDRAGQSVTDPYARSQVFAVIDILTNLAHRVEWKRADLQVSVDELRMLLSEIVGLLDDNGSCPVVSRDLRGRLFAVAAEPLSDDLAKERERLNRILIDTMEIVAASRTQIPPVLADAIDHKCNAYLRRQLDRDVALVRRPLFRRMSEA